MTNSILTVFAAWCGFFRRLRHDRRGNVVMLVGLAVVPLTVATGISIDYARAARLQTKMNAAADAAALAAVGKPWSQETNATVKTRTTAMFNAQVAGMPGLTYNNDVTVTITGGPGASNTRTANVSYTAKSSNAFSGVIGMSTITIGGVSQATSSQAPNIDFYVLIDTSPSMLLPATSAGLASMTAATSGRFKADGSKIDSCAFACHQSDLNPKDSNEVICDKNGKNCIDYYQVARNNNLVLRTDLVKEAIKDLTDVATSTAATNGAKYRMGLADFDYTYRQLYPTLPIAGMNVDGNLTNVRNHVDDAVILSYCVNNQRVCGVGDNDTGTNVTAAFTGALATMPVSPGDGTNVAGDSPQAILFLVTDGMRDEDSGGRQLGPIPLAQCNTIKKRKIRIAVLNTQYLPESASDDWSKTNVRDPFLSPTDTISPALIACASPGLYYQVTTDSDISAALAALFQKAVSTAHITQ